MNDTGDTPAKGGNGSGDGPAEDVAPASEAEGAEPDRLALLEAEKIDLRERLMRALAETENMRRRSEREAADARAYAVTNFARDMLTVADNMRRALDSVPKGEAEADGALKSLVEGIELTERDFLKTLTRHGVRQLDPKGQKFDPNMHQAMFEVPDETVPSGTVMQVVQSGYAIGDRVLRPAMVGVSKGGPRPAAAPSDPGAKEEPAG